MLELRELLERRAERFQPAPNGLERVRQRALRRSRTRRASAAMVALCLVAAAGFGLWRAFAHVGSPHPAATSQVPTASARPTAASAVEATIQVSAFHPTISGAVGRYLWYVAADDGALGRIDPATDRPVGKPLYCSMTLPVGAFGSLWTSGDNDNGCMPGPRSGARLWRLDPNTGRVVATIPVAAQTVSPGPIAPNVSAGEGAIWLSSSAEIGTGDNFRGVPGIVARVDPATNRVTGQIQVSKDDLRVAAGEGALWVVESPQSGQRPATLVRFDPVTLTIQARIGLGRGATGLGIGFGFVWVANSHDGTIMRIDPKTNVVTATTDVPDGVLNVIVAPDGIWTTGPEAVNRTVGVVTRIDPATGRITARIEIPTSQGVGVAYVQTYAFGSLWADAEPQTILRIAVPGS